MARNVNALQAYELFSQNGGKKAFLVDVRTRAEYALLGHPPEAYNIPWRTWTGDFQVQGEVYKDGKAPYTGYQLSAQPNPDFVGVVTSLFKPEDKIFIISTDGADGAEAADALAQAGFKNVYNILHGFLGQPLSLDDSPQLAQKYSPRYGLRGYRNGWVFWGLPVSHQINPRLVYPPDLKRMQSLE